MKILGKTHVLIMSLIAFSFAVWIQIVFWNWWFNTQRQPRTFPCTYIKGSCTVKPTYKNCKQFGQVPISVCETRLNYGDFSNGNR